MGALTVGLTTGALMVFVDDDVVTLPFAFLVTVITVLVTDVVTVNILLVGFGGVYVPAKSVVDVRATITKYIFFMQSLYNIKNVFYIVFIVV